MTYVAGSSFTFDITLDFTSGGAIANLNGLSYWMNQNTPAGAPFVFAITLRDATGSLFTDLQTPGITYPQNMTPFNTSDLGALSTDPHPTGAYFIAHITMSISGSAAAGVYTIGNTTVTTPGVGGRISVMNDDQGHNLPDRVVGPSTSR